MEKDKSRPKRRFAGFTDDWEQRKLGEVGETFTGLSGKTKEDFGHGEASFVTYMNVYSNVIADSDGIDRIEIDDRQKQVKYGDVLFTTSSETPEEVGMSSVWLGNMENLYLNSFCFGFRLTKQIDLYFLAFMLRTPEIRKRFVLLAQGISRYNISKNKVMEISIAFPEIEEQERIGSFLCQLDNLITLHQHKFDKLKTIKQAYLSEMFPQRGESIPKRRFAGFTNDWKLCKLLDNIDNIIDYRGRTPKKLGMDWSDSGYLALSALNVKNGFIDPTADAHYGDEQLFQKWMNGYKLHKGQVLFTTEAPVGNVAQIPDNKGYILSQRTIAFETNRKKITNDFLATLLRTPKVFGNLSALSSGGTAKGVSQKSLSELMINIPQSLNEQNSIGVIFNQLDNLITLQQRKLEKLQDIKKAYLNDMFV